MPLIMESHDYLPYFDEARPSTEAERAAARELVSSSLDPEAASTLHASIPTAYEPVFSPTVTTSHELLATTKSARAPNTGIDLTRYQEPSAPTTSTGTPSSERREQWRAALTQAYTSHSYLSSRQLNLSLLERFGKNAWLISNSQLEDELRVLEQELAEVRRQVDATDEERRQRQVAIAGEIEGLEQAWRSGVGRAIEAEVAGEVLRRQILEKSRR